MSLWLLLKKQKTFSIFLLIHRDTRSSLRGHGILWEHELQASVSSVLGYPKLARVFFFYLIETQRKCFPFLFKNAAIKGRKSTKILFLIIKVYMLILFGFTIITSRAWAIFVFLSSYRLKYRSKYPLFLKCIIISQRYM